MEARHLAGCSVLLRPRERCGGGREGGTSPVAAKEQGPISHLASGAWTPEALRIQQVQLIQRAPTSWGEEGRCSWKLMALQIRPPFPRPLSAATSPHRPSAFVSILPLAPPPSIPHCQSCVWYRTLVRVGMPRAAGLAGGAPHLGHPGSANAWSEGTCHVPTNTAGRPAPGSHEVGRGKTSDVGQARALVPGRGGSWLRPQPAGSAWVQTWGQQRPLLHLDLVSRAQTDL